MSSRTVEIRFANHSPIDSFPVVDGEVAPGGIPVSRLAEIAGRTPLYVYDRAAIDAGVERLRALLPPLLQLHYAIKANPFVPVVQHLASITDGLDVASSGEMLIALDTGVRPDRISFAGPGKSAAEIRRAVAAGVTVTAESEVQVEQARHAGLALGVPPRVALRVNPSFELKASGMRMGGGPKPFGIDEAQIPGVLARMRSAGVRLVGLHIFAGSQNLRADAIIEAQEKTFELGRRLAALSAEPLEWLNIGGGFGVPYFPGEQPLDVARVAASLHSLCERAPTEIGAPIVIELGRYLVAHAGLYVCRILERKESGGQTFLITDGGLHHHLAASGNFGQVLRKNYPVAIANRIDAELDEVQSVVGPLCTPLDLLADRVKLARARPGDLVAVFQSGAYGPSASPSAFLGHPPPVELLV